MIDWIKERKTNILIAIFIVGVALMLGYCESAEADWAIEEQHDSNAGTTEFNQGWDRVCVRYTYESGTSFYGCPLGAVGGDIEGDTFEIGIADKLWPRWEGEIRMTRYRGEMNGGFGVRRVIGDGPFQLFLGGSYWIDQSFGSDSDFTFNLGIRYTF